MVPFLAASSGGGASNLVSVVVALVTGGGTGLVALWRINAARKVAQNRADDQAYQVASKFYNETLARQDADLKSAIGRAEKSEKGLRQAALMVDRLTGLLDANGVTIPAHLQSRPWENGNGNGAPPPPKEGS